MSGFIPALIAMRAPMNSWDRGDSSPPDSVGEKDKELSLKLQHAGPEHCKHLRMIQVWAEIAAPREWLIQMDTYRYGVEKVSCSTMHKLTARPLTEDDFEHDAMNEKYFRYMLDSINGSMTAYQLETDPERKKEIWRGIIEALPQSYIQKRYYMFSYAALRNIVRQREGHKLKEWETFIDWCRTLPNSWMIFE